MKQSPLSDKCKEIMLGSLLGDSSLTVQKRYIHPRFSFRHSTNQESYFFWKASSLKEIASDKCTWHQGSNEKRDGFGYEKLRFQSKALSSLDDIFAIITKRGKKQVTRKWLNKLTPLSLAIWWCDDGSLIANTRKGVLCTDGYSLEEVEIIKKYFKVVWGIETKISTTSKSNFAQRRYYRLYLFSRVELEKLLRIILPFIPVKEMLYKVLILYKDSNLQERWISEIVEKTSFDVEEVNEIVNLRKSKLKAFQKMI